VPKETSQLRPSEDFGYDATLVWSVRDRREARTVRGWQSGD